MMHITIPERAETIAAQMEWLIDGKRQAVLITPGAALPVIPEGFRSWGCGLGLFIFNPLRTSWAEIRSAVRQDRVGDVLEYGIARKPTDADRAIVIRSDVWIEKLAVVTNEENAARVLARAEELAGPRDKIMSEDPRWTCFWRKHDSVLDELTRYAKAGKPCFAEWAPERVRQYLEFHLTQKPPTCIFVLSQAGDVEGLAVGWRTNAEVVLQPNYLEQPFHWQASDVDGDAFVVAQMICSNQNARKAIVQAFQQRWADWRGMRMFAARVGELVEYPMERLIGLTGRNV